MVGAMATVNSLLGDSLQCAVQPLSTTSLVVLKMTDSLWTAISGRRVTDEIALCQRARHFDRRAESPLKKSARWMITAVALKIEREFLLGPDEDTPICSDRIAGTIRSTAMLSSGILQ